MAVNIRQLLAQGCLCSSSIRATGVVIISDLLWSPYVIGQTIIFSSCGFFLSVFFPRLISAVANWMSAILPHMVCDLSANLRCRSEPCCTRLAENTGRKSRQRSPSGHHRTTLSGYIFATKAHIDNRKKLVKQQYVLQMSPQYGELQPTSG